jgi:hypothetical protein
VKCLFAIVDDRVTVDDNQQVMDQVAPYDCTAVEMSVNKCLELKLMIDFT